MYSYSILQTPEKVKMKVLKFKKKKLLFAYAVRESLLDKTLFSDPEKTKTCLRKSLRLTFIMSLRHKHSQLCLDLQPWVNYVKEKRL